MSRFESVVAPSTTIRATLALMGSSAANKFIPGFAVLVDARGMVVGVVTDGDVRRGLSNGAELDDPVERIANRNPLVLDRTLSRSDMERVFMAEVQRRGANYLRYTKVVLVDPDGRFFDVARLADLDIPQIEHTHRYFEIARLRLDDGISFDRNTIRVDLDKVTESDHLIDDVGLLRSAGSQNYFYLSGGGSVLLNNRYLLVVRRSSHARVNPGRLSLLTGRADGPLEWREPWRLVRELFEELVLFKNEAIVRFQYPPLQAIIDKEHEEHCSRYRKSSISVSLNAIALPTHRLVVLEKGSRAEFDLHIHVNSNNDLNAIFVFSAMLDMSELSASDGEVSDPFALPRDIIALDIETFRVRALSADVSEMWQEVDPGQFTEHLASTVDVLRSPDRVAANFGSQDK